MTYIPVIVPPTPPSPRTRELADELARVMVDFEQKHPTVTRGEVTEATRLALQSTRSQGAMGPMLSALGLGLAAAAGLGLYVAARSGVELRSLFSSVAVVAAALVVCALVYVLRRQP